MSFYENEKSFPKYLIHENSECQHFFISEKTAPKTEKFSTLYLIFKGPPFQYHKVRPLTFCNILYLEMDF